MFITIRTKMGVKATQRPALIFAFKMMLVILAIASTAESRSNGNMAEGASIFFYII